MNHKMSKERSESWMQKQRSGTDDGVGMLLEGEGVVGSDGATVVAVKSPRW